MFEALNQQAEIAYIKLLKEITDSWNKGALNDAVVDDRIKKLRDSETALSTRQIDIIETALIVLIEKNENLKAGIGRRSTYLSPHNPRKVMRMGRSIYRAVYAAKQAAHAKSAVLLLEALDSSAELLSFSRLHKITAEIEQHATQGGVAVDPVRGETLSNKNRYSSGQKSWALHDLLATLPGSLPAELAEAFAICAQLYFKRGSIGGFEPKDSGMELPRVAIWASRGNSIASPFVPQPLTAQHRRLLAIVTQDAGL